MKKGVTRSLALVLTVVLVLGGVIGGTVAWLIANPDPVVNTFTYGDINLTLTETDTGDGDENPNTNSYKMVPGLEITKDPIIKVIKGSEDMWLFVKLEKSADFDNFMTFEVDGDWTALDGVDGVYYQSVAASTVAGDNKDYTVIKDNTVKVKEDVTKEMLNALTAYPTLTVTAYGVQAVGNATAADAWVKVDPTAFASVTP